MATILTKKSDTSSSVPLAADLTNAAGGAELAVNTADKRLYSKTSGGSVVELGTNPSALSLPNGTANGVPYLNGSKVLTSGSALTFDGTNLGIGTTTPSFASGMGLALNGGGGQARLALKNNSTGDGALDGFQLVVGTDSTAFIEQRENAPMAFSVNNTEGMRLTSTGLGIGTSSPGERLTIVGAGVTYASLKGETTTLYQVAGDAACGFFNNAAVPLTFGTNSTERMRLDSSGNLGLGVTPSAWGSSWRSLDVGGGGAFAGAFNSAYMLGNAYYSASGGVYKSTGAAGHYGIEAGTHVWKIAPSGTAGNAISFTQAMTLDANAALYTDGGTGKGRVTIQNAAANNDILSTTSGFGAYNPLRVIASEVRFETGSSPSERARIDSSGNLLVGTTSIFGGLNGLNMQDKNIVQRNSAAASGRFRWQGVDNNNTLIVYDQNNTGVYMVNGGSSWASNSDERLKTTLIPFENAAAKVCAIRAGTGRYLTDEESVSRSFLIAQDVQAVLPEAVNVRDDEIGTLGLQYTDVIPLLTAAIQEQQAIIEGIKTRLAALESK